MKIEARLLNEFNKSFSSLHDTVTGNRKNNCTKQHGQRQEDAGATAAPTSNKYNNVDSET